MDIFSSSSCSDHLWSQPDLLSDGYRGYIPGVKRPRPRHEADHSPPYIAEVKNASSFNSTPLILVTCCLMKWSHVPLQYSWRVAQWSGVTCHSPNTRSVLLNEVESHATPPILVACCLMKWSHMLVVGPTNSIRCLKRKTWTKSQLESYKLTSLPPLLYGYKIRLLTTGN
jgi:hypothetical protein